MNRYRYSIIILGIVVLIAVLFTLLFDIKIESSALPTLVNGITSSTSIILGLSGVVIGTMLRDTRIDRRTKNFYYTAMALLLLPLTMLWITYFFLAMSSLGSWLSYQAVKIALSGLIETIYLFFGIVLYTVKSADIEQSS